MRRPVTVAIACATALWVAGCAQERQPDDRPAAPDATTVDTLSVTDSAPPAPAPADSPAPAGIAPAAPAPAADTGWTVGSREGPAPAGVATLRGVRAARNEGFDRVVFDFGAGPLPGYHVEYVDRPQHECGSGAEVRLAGDAWLQLDLEPARAHDDQGKATVTERASRPNLNNLIEMRAICDFEARVSWVMGVRTPGRFRVLRLGNPSRLVVDIRP